MPNTTGKKRLTNAEISKRYRERHPERCKQRTRAAYLANPEKFRQLRRDWYAENKEKVTAETAEIKRETLSHYGKNGQIRCGWPFCGITDIDVLSLDHMHDDGAEDRRIRKVRGGHTFYRQLRKQRYPPGYQTLCMNHQFKKDLVRRRSR